MRGFGLVFIALLCSADAFGWNYPTYDFCAAETKLTFLLDADNSLTRQEALERLRSRTLQTSPQTINYGYTKGTAWLYLKVKHAEKWQKCMLELANPQLDEIIAYQVLNSVPAAIERMGDEFPFSERFYRVRNYAFPFRADQDREILFSLKSTATMTVPVKIQWRDQYVSDSSGDYLMLGLFYGILIFFIFFGFHSAISFRNRGYLIYTLFAASMLLFFIDRDGISFQYLWPNAVAWKARSVRVFAAISMALAVMYYASILRVGRRTLFACYSYIGLCALLILALLVLDPGLTNFGTILVSLATPLFMILLPLSVFKRDKIFAPYLLVAGLFSLVGLLFYSMSVTHLASSSFMADNAMKISTLLEFIFLSLGIHKKIRTTMRKKALHKAVFEISNMLAHDVKKPLDKMNRLLMRMDTLPREDREAHLVMASDSIKEDLSAADSMLSDLIDMGREPNEYCETDLTQLIRKVLNGRYKCDLAHSGTVKASTPSLARVFDNITKNAQQATTGKSDCQYWINTQEVGKFTRISIGNTGSKIEKSDLPEVFRLFFTKGKKKGNGIGLAYVQHMVHQSGGAVSVESNGWSSTGRRVQVKHSCDYVEFQLTLPKGERNGPKTTHSSH